MFYIHTDLSNWTWLAVVSDGLQSFPAHVLLLLILPSTRRPALQTYACNYKRSKVPDYDYELILLQSNFALDRDRLFLHLQWLAVFVDTRIAPKYRCYTSINPCTLIHTILNTYHFFVQRPLQLDHLTIFPLVNAIMKAGGNIMSLHAWASD